MAGGNVIAATKPVMRGFLHSNIKKNLSIAIILAAASGIAWRVFYQNPRMKLYSDYYKTYDPEAHFVRMKEAGLMQSDAP